MALKDGCIKRRLSEEAVRLIRASDEPYQILADRFAVSESLISSIRTGRRYVGVG
jgi:hypothetical protein